MLWPEHMMTSRMAIAGTEAGGLRTGGAVQCQQPPQVRALLCEFPSLPHRKLVSTRARAFNAQRDVLAGLCRSMATAPVAGQQCLFHTTVFCNLLLTDSLHISECALCPRHVFRTFLDGGVLSQEQLEHYAFLKPLCADGEHSK